MDVGLEVIAVSLAVAGAVAALLVNVLKDAEVADHQEALFEALREAGFLPQRDARDWVKSRLPRLDIRHVYVSRNRRSSGQIIEKFAPIPLAARDDAQFHQAVFLLPPSIRRTHDRLVFAFDPKKSPVITMPDSSVQDAIRRETGWELEAHGAWLVLYRREAVETKPSDVPALVEQAAAVARRVLGGGLR